MKSTTKYKATIVLSVTLLLVKIFALGLLVAAGIAGAVFLIRNYLTLPNDWYIIGGYFVGLWVLVDLMLTGSDDR